MKRFVKVIYALLVFAVAAGICSCEKEDGYIYPEYHDELYYSSDLYISIIGFNNELHTFRYPYNSRYNFVSISYGGLMQDFIKSLSPASGTILYYGVETAIDYLMHASFPRDLNNVAIVTFTDGLDQGSSAMNPKYGSASAYLSAINNRLKKSKVNGTTNISAYTIGLKGNDVMDDAQFKQNLKGLASSDANAFEVSNMLEVYAKFSEIASSLYNESASQSVTLTIPQPYNNTRIRFTFDIPDGGNAGDSKYYIEGTYKSDALTDIRYEGLTSSSGNKVAVSSKNGVNVSFKFSDFRFVDNFSTYVSNIKQWSLTTGTNQWQINSEFNPDASVDTTTERKSAAIVLLLDCSSSLGNDIEYVKSAAFEFIYILDRSYNGW